MRSRAQPRRKFCAVRSCFRLRGPPPDPPAGEALGTGEAMPSGNWTFAGSLDMEAAELSDCCSPCAAFHPAGIKGTCNNISGLAVGLSPMVATPYPLQPCGWVAQDKAEHHALQDSQADLNSTQALAGLQRAATMSWVVHSAALKRHASTHTQFAQSTSDTAPLTMSHL